MKNAWACRLAAAAFVALLCANVGAASADRRYDTNGEDVYRVGTDTVVSRVGYSGTQSLSVRREGKETRYEARARYTRSDGSTKAVVDARFVQVLLADGSFRDEVDEDPDFLTILNQPFAVQLDPATLRDVRGLHGKVPFDATSPLGGRAVLHGFLLPAPAGDVDGNPAAGVRFRAEGPMSGDLPDHAGTTVSGRMRMNGVAYYALGNALLLALNAKLTIVARLRDKQHQSVPVEIVYRREIRVDGGGPLKTPQPTPPPADGGTATPGVP